MATLALATGCGQVARAPPRGLTVAPPAAAASGEHYRIDPARSEVRILVYRAGPLARLGHNHVLLARALEGEVWVPADPAAARFRLTLPVATLDVDERAARRDEGEEFVAEPSDADIAATRRNMLGPEVLAAAEYRLIRLSGEGARGPEGLIARTRLSVRDRTLEVDVPVEVAANAGELAVHGGFAMLQSAFGLTPFSVAFGALRVRDELAIRFRLVAVKDPAS